MSKNAKQKKTFVPRAIIPPTPMFMRRGGRKRTLLTLCTTGVFAGTKTKGYVLDSEKELDRVIDEAMHPDFRIGLVNFALPPVSHVFIMMRLDTELRIYDVQNHYAASGEVGITTWYEDYSNEWCDCTGYRYLVNGLLSRMMKNAPDEIVSLRFMPSPELSPEEWEIIDYGAETGKRPTPEEVRGPCMLWCDAVLNHHWEALLEEAYGVHPY